MSDIAIRAEGLSKRYRLGTRERYRTLRDTITDTFTAPFGRSRSAASSDGAPESFWALKDVSFKLTHGEVIGIIGRNGAGKSTLLKILSRITEPTEGQAQIHGRIASLLEVGTGFHPELSGRDNIYLNGAILGMKKAEIRRKFDEIVAFAEVEKFIDTPVKHYSSGMYVRLAFAVAAHLEPEILVVDEVLAVGDHQFQAKCLNKMNEVSQAGRTVLFVSHSMSAIQRLCKRVLVLSGGRIQADTDVMGAIAEYLSVDIPTFYSGHQSPNQPSITQARVVINEEDIHLSIAFHSPFPLTPPVLGFVIYDPLGNTVFGTNSRVERFATCIEKMSSGHIDVMIPAANLRPNQYFISLWLGDQYVDYHFLDKAIQVWVEGGGARADLPVQFTGSFHFPTRWCFQSQTAPSSSPAAGAELVSTL
jgi:lipopolysaccharide transport system ATP-binding protein